MKNILIGIVVLVGLIYALPNIFDQDPALEITGVSARIDSSDGTEVSGCAATRPRKIKSLDSGSNKLLLQIFGFRTQLRQRFPGNIVWRRLHAGPDSLLRAGLAAVGGRSAMYLGLDLRGGIHA